jgi:hypothetical protein
MARTNSKRVKDFERSTTLRGEKDSEDKILRALEPEKWFRGLRRESR